MLLIVRRTSLRLTLEDQRSVGSDQTGESTGSTDGPSGSLGVDGDISSKDDGVPSVPALALDPVDGVEERSGTSVTGVLAVDPLDVHVARSGKEVHEDGLYGLGLVDDRLGPYVQSSDRGRVDRVLFQEGADGGEGERVDVFPVVGAGHVLLTETDGVLSLGDTVKVFELVLRDALLDEKQQHVCG